MQRKHRVLSGIALAMAWLLTDAAPWITEQVMPEPRGRWIPTVPDFVAAVESAFAGALTLGVLALCAWLMFAGGGKQRR